MYHTLLVREGFRLSRKFSMVFLYSKILADDYGYQLFYDVITENRRGLEKRLVFTNLFLFFVDNEPEKR